MATIREYFDSDVKVLSSQSNWVLANENNKVNEEIIAKIAYDFESNSKYWYFYIPETVNLSECLVALINSTEFENCRLGPKDNEIYIEMGHAEYSERQSNQTLQFTRRVHLYIEFDLTPEGKAALVSEFHVRGYFLSIRDRQYARIRSSNAKPLAFISHDTRDKDAFVRGLAIELSKNFCSVWYDEFSLKVGDSLRTSIERGLSETKKCIVVLSPNFLSNEGWGRAEFDSIFTREIIEKKNVMLPVWLNVEAKDVYNYCPRLADKLGLAANLGVQEVARRIAITLKTEE